MKRYLVLLLFINVFLFTSCNITEKDKNSLNIENIEDENYNNYDNNIDNNIDVNIKDNKSDIGSIDDDNNTNIEEPIDEMLEENLIDDYIIQTGIFTGRIDPHSIEMNMNEMYQVFWLSDELINSFAKLNIVEGDKVKIEYIIENGNKIIYNITKIGS